MVCIFLQLVHHWTTFMSGRDFVKFWTNSCVGIIIKHDGPLVPYSEFLPLLVERCLYTAISK